MTMALQYLCVLLLCVLSVKGDFLTKKLCKDVDWAMCSVHHVVMDSCPAEPHYCSVKRGKPYSVTVDFTPHFSAQSMDMAMYGDDSNTNTFNKTIKAPQTACGVMTCPLEQETRRIFDYNFVLDKTLNLGKYPVKVKFWNLDNPTQSCCFTFTINVPK